MREIKFRAWNKKDKKMFIPSKIYFDDWGQLWKIPYGFGMVFQANMILMQFTGLKDKNGKEIYEGDIVEEKFRGNGTVVFNDGCFEVFGDALWHFPLMKIIGNIYENPDLLEGK